MKAPINDLVMRACSSRETVSTSYHMAAMCIEQGIRGDFVECGVFAGSQVAAMARALMNAGSTDRKVHLFDSFTGIPQAGPKDIEFLQAKHPAGLSACSEADVRRHMEEWDIDQGLLVFHAGLFADTVPKATIEEIALLRLDGDLYDSTHVCLEFFYPKLSQGGVCIVDDYHLAGAREAVTELLGYPSPAYWVK